MSNDPLPKKADRRRPLPSHIISKDAADQAVKRVFEILGVDIDKPEQVEEFREGLRFGSYMMNLAKKSIAGFIIALFTSLAGAIVWSWYKS